MDMLLQQIKNCKECEQHLKDGVNPVIAASPKSKIIIIGQAPGRIVHDTGIPWNDKSGDNLRNWYRKCTQRPGDPAAPTPLCTFTV